MVPGGAAEALNYSPEEIKLVLNKRKGFIKMALKFGRDLVPVFSFGESFLYSQVANPAGSRLRRFQDWFKKYCGFSPPAFYGRGIFQYSLGLIPYRKPLNVVVGAPIQVDKVEDPSEGQINELHAKYVKALKDLYDNYNPVYGDKNIRLVIN